MNEKVLNTIDMDKLIICQQKIIQIRNQLYSIKKEISKTNPSILNPYLKISDIECNDYKELLMLDINANTMFETINDVLRQMSKPEYLQKSKLCLGGPGCGKAYP